MIRSFRHKALKRLLEENDARGLNVEQTEKLRRIVVRVNSAKVIADLDLPGYRLHALKGDLQDFYSVTVRVNQRVIFQFEQGEALNVDYVDYH